MAAVSWEETKRQAAEVRRAAGVPERSAAERAAAKQSLRDAIQAYRLADLRRGQSLTQAEVAEIMGVSGPRVSEVERGDVEHVTVATLRAYVRALGGELHIVADFGDTVYTVAS